MKNEIAAYNLLKLVKDVVWKETSGGYVYTKFRYYGDNITVYRHRFNFFLANGFIPEKVDHKDGVPGNDEDTNLRAANSQQNAHNTKMYSTNTSGIKGISWNKNRSKWEVQVTKNGKKHFGGHFDDIKLAKAAVEGLRSRLHGDFARH